MYKKISEMSDADKVDFLEHTKQAMVCEQGIPWKYIEKRMVEEIENIFDDEKLQIPADRCDHSANIGVSVPV